MFFEENIKLGRDDNIEIKVGITWDNSAENELNRIGKGILEESRTLSRDEHFNNALGLPCLTPKNSSTRENIAGLLLQLSSALQLRMLQVLLKKEKGRCRLVRPGSRKVNFEKKEEKAATN